MTTPLDPTLAPPGFDISGLLAQLAGQLGQGNRSSIVLEQFLVKAYHDARGDAEFWRSRALDLEGQLHTLQQERRRVRSAAKQDAAETERTP